MNRMIRSLLLLSAFVLSLPAVAQLGTTYNEGPVTQVTYLKIEYGHCNLHDYLREYGRS